MSREDEILKTLETLEQELRALALWGGPDGRPPEAAFGSTMPFCLDTMAFHQWLEYVLIAEIRKLAVDKKELPNAVLTHTMAQEVYKGSWSRYRSLIALLKKLDSLF